MRSYSVSDRDGFTYEEEMGSRFVVFKPFSVFTAIMSLFLIL